MADASYLNAFTRYQRQHQEFGVPGKCRFQKHGDGGGQGAGFSALVMG
jgi:hypothetical protein